MRRLLPVGLVALAAAGCGNPPGGDPGNKRYDELRTDGVFAALPPGAHRLTTVARQAWVGSAGFGGKVWQGPSMVVTFEDRAPRSSVTRFYADRAAAAGWRATRAGVWTKTYGDGAPATLLLVALPEGRYTLNGGVAPKT
jgi:hypothetical protein